MCIRDSGCSSPYPGCSLWPSEKDWSLRRPERPVHAPCESAPNWLCRDVYERQVRDLSDAEAEDAAITENLQREDVRPREEAAAYKRALQSGRHTIESLSLIHI